MGSSAERAAGTRRNKEMSGRRVVGVIQPGNVLVLQATAVARIPATGLIIPATLPNPVIRRSAATAPRTVAMQSKRTAGNDVACPCLNPPVSDLSWPVHPEISAAMAKRRSANIFSARRHTAIRSNNEWQPNYSDCVRLSSTSAQPMFSVSKGVRYQRVKRSAHRVYMGTPARRYGEQYQEPCDGGVDHGLPLMAEYTCVKKSVVDATPAHRKWRAARRKHVCSPFQQAQCKSVVPDR
jgi:hypothetical protein